LDKGQHKPKEELSVCATNPLKKKKEFEKKTKTGGEKKETNNRNPRPQKKPEEITI